tara:strand:- start:1856 stop:2707 length:852 start_codon:yes stop_codon:yes gene_type:complete
MAKKVKRKIKKKTKTAQKQKQKQSQRTSVTVNIVNSKRKPRASAKPNTNRVLQQFAQPLITLPSNLINPPQIPDMGGLNISSLQRGTNQGLTGNIVGEDLEARERMRKIGNPLFGYQEPTFSNVTPSFMGRPSDTLRNYQSPEQSLSGFSSPVPSNFTVDTASSSDVSQLGLSAGAFKPIQQSLIKKGRPKKQLVRVRQNVSGLSAEPPADVGVPQAGNPSLRPPDERVTERLISGKKGEGQPLQMLPRKTRDEDYFFNLQRDSSKGNLNDPRETLSDSVFSY